jgi:hypothetical protein
MPLPITQDAAVLDGGTARLHGRVNPGGAVARAWFEWGTGTNYTATESQLVGSGTTFLSIADSITGLLPETVYQFRLVSSNEFGIRHGIPRTLRTLNFSLLTGGVNAWQITDDLAQSGSTLTYITNLTLPQRQAATSNGWQFTINSRLTTDFGGGQTMVFGYGTGPDRFLIWLDFDASGNLSAEIPGLGTYRLTTNGIGTNIYHTHEIRCTNGNATYFFDGTPKGIGWRGSTVNHPAGQVFWGAGSSPGMGQMNFHQVRFETLGVVASYDAGSGGNPPEAPNPVTRGWTNNAGTILLSDHAIAPDGEPFVPAVETLQASDSDTSSAQLNAQVNPHGDATVAWFEWGLTTSYDKRTPIRPVGSGQAHTNFNEPIGGLSPSTVYHCRVVASNGFGIRMGNDRTFQTASYVMTGNLPNAWQITDDSSAANSRWNYTTNLNLEQRSAASNSWRFTIISRLVTDYGGTETMAFVYGNGGRRYAVFWDLDTNGNLTARLEGQTNRIVASNNLGATLYHTHELSYTNSVATYSVDGRVIASWTGTNSTAQPGQAFWGAGFSAGQGQMNFRRVEFQVGGSNVVGTYDAGTQGAPAPDPVTRGWTLDDPGAARATNLTEQLEIFLPTVDTLAATAIGSTSAQLNGRVSANGRETYTWFEWGIRTTYGIRTPEQDGEAGFEAINTSNAISGLAVDTTYHFRVVASNSIATRFGHDQTFRTTWFTDAGIHLPSVNDGSVAWGDCDNDGDLDLLLTGQTDFGDVSRIYRNDGGGSFAQITAPLIGVSHSSAAWGDYDRDGDLDILLSGLSPTGAVSHVYRNDGVNFTAINANLPGVFMSSVAWVDCDNDGDLDILLTGADDATNRLARIYRNDGATNFVNMNAGFEGTSDGAAASGDFDGDADHDFIITGLDSSGTLSVRYYRNDGAGVFTHADLNLPAVYSSSIAPADFDNDGDLDLLLSGSSAEGEITRLFRNIRNGPELEFEEVQTILANVSSSSVAWGDFDNDGDPDIALSGWGGKPFTAIYRNDGHGIFLPLTKELTGLFSSSTAWADLDNDGDLDLLLTGRNDEGSAPARALHVYRNVSPIANTAPTAPSGLEGSGVGYSATVNWQPANDSTTPLSALTYNLVLSSVTNGIDIASPMANTTNGYRRIATFGSAGYNHSWTFTGLTPGKYYFSVQAIDSTYVGGPFAPWQSFEVAVPPVVIIASEILQPGRVRIHFAGSDGVAYDVWASADLQAWARLGPGVTLAPGEFEYIDAAAPLNRRFYQIRRVTP